MMGVKPDKCNEDSYDTFLNDFMILMDMRRCKDSNLFESHSLSMHEAQAGLPYKAICSTTPVHIVLKILGEVPHFNLQHEFRAKINLSAWYTEFRLFSLYVPCTEMSLEIGKII